jgi:hypothetical protein
MCLWCADNIPDARTEPFRFSRKRLGSRLSPKKKRKKKRKKKEKEKEIDKKSRPSRRQSVIRGYPIDGFSFAIG